MQQWSDLKDWQKAVVIAVGITATSAAAYLAYKNFVASNAKDSASAKATGEKTKASRSQSTSSVSSTMSSATSPVAKAPKAAKSTDASAAKAQEAVPESPTDSMSPEELEVIMAQVAEFKKTGNASYRSKDYDEALKAYNAALDICPRGQERAILLSNRGAVLMFKRSYDQVVKDCSQAIAIKPGYTRAWSRRAQALEALGQAEKALRDYTAILLMTELKDPKASAAIDRLITNIAKEKTIGMMKERSSDIAPPRVIHSYLDNYSDDTFGTYVEKERVPTLRAELEKDPKNGDIMATLVYGLIASDEFAEAYKLAGTAVDRLQEMTLTGERKKVIAGLMNYAATIKFLSMDYAQCETLLAASMRFDKSHHAAYLRLAAARIELGKAKEAMEDYETARRLAPENAEVYYHLAQGQISLGASLMAISNLEKALSLDCNLYNAYVTSAVLMMQQNNYSTAIDTMKIACEKFEGNAYAYLNLGEFYFQNGYAMDAKQCFDKALEINANLGLPYVYEAMAKMSQEDEVGAVASFKEAIEKDPQCDIAYVRLAQLSSQKGEYDEAIELYDKAIETSYAAGEMVAYFSCKLACEAEKDVVKKYPTLKHLPRPIFQF